MDVPLHEVEVVIVAGFNVRDAVDVAIDFRRRLKAVELRWGTLVRVLRGGLYGQQSAGEKRKNRAVNEMIPGGETIPEEKNSTPCVTVLLDKGQSAPLAPSGVITTLCVCNCVPRFLGTCGKFPRVFDRSNVAARGPPVGRVGLAPSGTTTYRSFGDDTDRLLMAESGLSSATAYDPQR